MRTKPAPKLNELVPIETLEQLRSLFKTVVGVPMVFTDPDGVPVTDCDDPLQYCGSLVRPVGNETLCLRRRPWDVPEPEVERAIKAEHVGGEPIGHRCRGGFRDMAVPVVVEGQTIGYAVFARSLPVPPDIEQFRQLAVEGGMDPQVGEEVARRSLVMPHERIAQVAEFLQVITGLVARAAYDTIRAKQVMDLEKLRDNLIHMIVHDLRTPLTSIIGGLQTVVHTEYAPDMTREFVPLALDGAEKLLEMVNTLLDINKMESGEMKLNVEPVKCAEIAETALNHVRGAAYRKQQKLAARVDPDCPVIEGDAEKLWRLLVNLVGNAIKFTQEGGRIELAAQPVEKGVIFSVSDNGPGIPPEYHEAIFEKFGQVENRASAANISTGLGLTFCRMVAEAHGGWIKVDSNVGAGSTFTVFIPAKPA